MADLLNTEMKYKLSIAAVGFPSFFVFPLNKFRSSISIQRQASFFQITYQQGQNINILRMEDYASPVTLVSKCQSSVSFIVSEPVLEVSYRQTKNI